MNSDYLALMLEEVIDALSSAMSSTDSFKRECPEDFESQAERLYVSLATCRAQTLELSKSLPAPEEVPQADNIKDAIALLEANGFIVGTKT